ncbi:MAG: tRNA (adenosine(37)-N6)-dimethylallyltransferase MiaA [Dyadobacter sp.]|uniref:tRNA (adenosine(37)-N6)-dimethylallyltransferase MiaA n=1 Tax=Dyadobacter sp. TaxID=1914288 RepID=UPI003266A7A9
MNSPLIVILGPTASGKTHIATRVAYELHGEVLSADSRQVYKNMDIGTGKDLGEYVVNGQSIPYHLINIREAGEQYNVNDFQQDFEVAYHQILARQRYPILCGGTGFYIHSLLKGHAYAAIPVNEPLREELENLPAETLLARFQRMHSAYHDVADTSTRKRLIRAIEIAQFLSNEPGRGAEFANDESKYEPIIFGLNPPIEVRRECITRRLNERLKNGLVEEVQQLLNIGLTAEQLIYYGLEYKFVTQYLTGESDYVTMHARLETEIHRFAKRQMTFFRKMEKDGLVINWLLDDWSETEKIRFISEKYQELKDGFSGIK